MYPLSVCQHKTNIGCHVSSGVHHISLSSACLSGRTQYPEGETEKKQELVRVSELFNLGLLSGMNMLCHRTEPNKNDFGFNFLKLK